MLNRCAVVARAKQPFLDWLKSLPEPHYTTLENINTDKTAYLLPEYSYDSEQDAILEQFYDLVFEEELLGWWDDERDWPQNRDFATFKKWFDVEFHSMILDVVDHPLTDKEGENIEMEQEQRVAYAWYRREQWALLRSAASDPERLEENFEDWVQSAEPAFQERKAQGMNIYKVDIDIEKLIKWCHDQGVPLNSAARAEFTARTLNEQKKHSGKINNSACTL